MPHTLKDELIRRGYVYSERILDRRYKQFFTPGGKLVITKGGYYDYPFVTQTTKKISKDKTLSYKFAINEGINVPKSLQTSNLAQAEAFLETYKKVIVKPAELGGSKGLTVDITDNDSLKKAIEKATFNGETPLIQEQFIGEELRMTILEGKVCSAMLRKTPRVVGDGTHTIQQLIEAENIERSKLSFPLITYPQLEASMFVEGLFYSQDVPDEDEIVELSRATVIKRGASLYGVLEEVHPSYIAIAEKLAAQLNPPMLVVDLMVKDHTIPATDSNYIFLEFNTSPSLYIYSSIRSGDRPDVISKFADLVDTYASLCK
ncbi:MAG: hypothetical protein WA030_04000 [Candidatus Microsaccharimonas sp.]